MKVKITFKDPDGVWEAVKDAARQSVASLNLSDDEAEMLIESRHDETMDALAKWIEYSEYITVEFDTEAGTATVKPRR